jgi:hypothetical protein
MSAKSEPLIPMPASLDLHNANHERCDMAQGPCACGAWHRLEDWPEVVRQEVKAAQEEKPNDGA